MDHSNGSVVSVSPFRCRVWRLHDRLEEQLTERTCDAEIRSFEEHGQLVPALGRPLQDPDYDVELICGARRLFVARHINMPLLVELRDISDKDGIIAMDIENRQRRDVSPYERGRSYARWLREGCFLSQEDLARALRVSASQVSRLLKIARLPSAVVGAFNSPLDICEGWGLDLAAALDNPQTRRSTLDAGRAMAAQAQRPPAHEIYQRLMSPSRGQSRQRPPAHDKIVKADNGTPLFRIKYQRSSIAFVFSADKTSSTCLDAIELAVAEVMTRYASDPQASIAEGSHLLDGRRALERM